MPKLCSDEPMVHVGVRIPESLAARVDQAAAAWNVGRSDIVRRAIADGIDSWQRGDADDNEMKAVLRFLRERAVTIQAMLNMMCKQDSSHPDWRADLEQIKAAINAAGEKA